MMHTWVDLLLMFLLGNLSGAILMVVFSVILIKAEKFKRLEDNENDFNERTGKGTN